MVLTSNLMQIILFVSMISLMTTIIATKKTRGTAVTNASRQFHRQNIINENEFTVEGKLRNTIVLIYQKIRRRRSKEIEELSHLRGASRALNVARAENVSAVSNGNGIDNSLGDVHQDSTYNSQYNPDSIERDQDKIRVNTNCPFKNRISDFVPHVKSPAIKFDSKHANLCSEKSNKRINSENVEKENVKRSSIVRKTNDSAHAQMPKLEDINLVPSSRTVRNQPHTMIKLDFDAVVKEMSSYDSAFVNPIRQILRIRVKTDPRRQKQRRRGWCFGIFFGSMFRSDNKRKQGGPTAKIKENTAMAAMEGRIEGCEIRSATPTVQLETNPSGSSLWSRRKGSKPKLATHQSSFKSTSSFGSADSRSSI